MTDAGIEAEEMRHTVRVFLTTSAIVFSGVLITSAFTGLKETAYAALNGVLLFAFFPVILFFCGLAIVCAAVLILALAAAFGGGGDAGGAEAAADAGTSIVEAGSAIIPAYYTFLANRRHPAFWGVPFGVLLGGGALWAYLAVFILPAEVRNSDAVLKYRTLIEQHYEEEGGFPRPGEDGSLRLEDLGEGVGPALDGYGRALEYQVVGRWKLASFQLRSLGRDGEPGADDLCVSGDTKLARIASGVDIHIGGKRPKFSDRLAAMRELRCGG